MLRGSEKQRQAAAFRGPLRKHNVISNKGALRHYDRGPIQILFCAAPLCHDGKIAPLCAKGA